MHVFTLTVPPRAVSRQMPPTDSVSFLTVPQHTKFNSLLCSTNSGHGSGHGAHPKAAARFGGERKTSSEGTREGEMEGGGERERTDRKTEEEERERRLCHFESPSQSR